MKYYYQLIVLGSDVEKRHDILNQIERSQTELGFQKKCIKIIFASDFRKLYKGNQPAFCLYFGDLDGDYKDVHVVETLIKEGTMILPVYFKDFDTEIPDILKNQNGELFRDTSLERISNLVLESFGLLRAARKIFISYRRTESTSVAIQLYEILEAYNFDVFLDTHSIRKGEPFQEELWHRMTDCDVIILLNTPGFLESEWCKEEFAEASAKQIGMVQLVWPDHEIENVDKASHISYPMQLSYEDFKVEGASFSTLTNEVVEKIINKVESVRARNLAARQDNLISDFRSLAEKNGRKVTVQPERILTETSKNGKHILYIPTVGIPQSLSCQSAEIKRELASEYKDASIRLLYDDLRIRNKWLEHLDWLNDNFKNDIKTLKKQDFEKWLSRR